MEDEQMVTEDTSNLEENLDSNQETEVVDEEKAKLKEIAENQRIRAEKAERELKALKKPVQAETETPKNELSRKEQILEARALNSLHEDDIDEVVAIAEAKKISLSEAVKSPYVKAFIKTREEERKTAEATSTAASKKSNRSSGDTLIKKALDNKLEPDEMKDAANDLVKEIFKR